MKLPALILASLLLTAASIHAMEDNLEKLFNNLRGIVQQQKELDEQRGKVNLAIITAIGQLPENQRDQASKDLFTLQGIPVKK